jgi:hypothetical protein
MYNARKNLPQIKMDCFLSLFLTPTLQKRGVRQTVLFPLVVSNLKHDIDWLVHTNALPSKKKSYYAKEHSNTCLNHNSISSFDVLLIF